MKTLAVLLTLFLSGLACGQTHTVNLTATPGTQPTGVTVVGYNFYQSFTSGSGYVKIGTAATPSFTTGVLDGGPTGGPGIVYFFVARAFRAPCGNCTPVETAPVESVNSNETSALVPAPILPPPAIPNPPANLTPKVN